MQQMIQTCFFTRDQTDAVIVTGIEHETFVFIPWTTDGAMIQVISDTVTSELNSSAMSC